MNYSKPQVTIDLEEYNYLLNNQGKKEYSEKAIEKTWDILSKIDLYYSHGKVYDYLGRKAEMPSFADFMIQYKAILLTL